MPSGIEKAITDAVAAHTGQLDKAGMPYILHPIRVMVKMPTTIGQIVAVLHDTVEDGHLTLTYIQATYGNRVAAYVDDLTKKPNVSYRDYILDIGNRSPKTVLAVKIADLEDNMNLLRLASVSAEDLERINRYIDAWNYLTYNRNEL